MILLRPQDTIHKVQLTRLLTEILDNSILSQNLYFKGGTCAAILGYLDRFSVDLDFDLTKISYLLDDKNNKYVPASWDGGSGGHHLSGTLYFSEPIKAAKTIKFVIENVYNVEKRAFIWEIKQ